MRADAPLLQCSSLQCSSFLVLAATEKGAAQVEALQKERAHIQASRDELKTVLYGRFGSNINLEE